MRGIVVVMGVTGTGKSTVGTLLARRLGVPFIEGDDYHDAASIDAMAHGHALTDADRAPWLDRINAVLHQDFAGGAVCACSALNQWARDRLTRGITGVRFVWLHGDPGLLAARIDARHDNPVGADLLPSQLTTLEPPTSANTLPIDVSATPDEIVEQAIEWLGVDSKQP
jgi:gluconokinase